MLLSMVVVGFVAGEGDECVFEACVVDAQLLGDDVLAGQRCDHSAQDISGSGDDDLVSAPLDPLSRPVARTADLRAAGRRAGSGSAARRHRTAGQRGRCVERDDAAAVDHRDAVAQPLGLFEVVGDEHDGHPAGSDLLDQGPHLAASLRVKARGQLVEHGDAGLSDQRQRNRKPLLLSA